jgi:uncharacterized protein YkwD
METQRPAPECRRPLVATCLVLLSALLATVAVPATAGAALRDEAGDVPVVGVRKVGTAGDAREDVAREDVARGRAPGAPKPVAAPPAPVLEPQLQQSGPAPAPAPAPTPAPTVTTTAPSAPAAAPAAAPAPAPPPVVLPVFPIAPAPAPEPPPAPVPAASPAGSGVEAEFLAGINGLRASAGLPGLVRDGELDRMAAEWSAQMAATGQLRHSGLVRRVVDSWGVAAGENVGRSGSVANMMAAFAGSSGHYSNLVQPIFTRVGIATVIAPDGTMWSTHLFAG